MEAVCAEKTDEYRELSMIDLTTDNIRATAQAAGFIKDNAEKAMRLIDILEGIFSTKWKDKLVLKGGTAINMFYMGMPRLSVDIDLDYIGSTREEMLADKKALSVYLRDSLFQKNYSLSAASKSYFGLDSFVFQHLNNAGNRDAIKAEINYLDRTHILPARRKAADALGYKGEIKISVLNEYELYGSKLAALIDRTKPRDVYDAHRMARARLLGDADLLRKCVLFYNCVGGDADALAFDADKLDALSKRDFDRMLKPMLSKKEKFDHKTAISETQEYLRGLLCFTPEEKSFAEDFKNKIYSPEKLFADHSVVLRLAWHPMAFWKCGKTDPESRSIQTERMKTAILMEGRGEESLSRAADRAALTQAMSHYVEKGETFMDLYDGKQIFPQDERNENALMSRLAPFCADKAQLLRIFKSSGQYRAEKTMRRYEDMAEYGMKLASERRQAS